MEDGEGRRELAHVSGGVGWERGGGGVGGAVWIREVEVVGVEGWEEGEEGGSATTEGRVGVRERGGWGMGG